jgi:hypothetical protein
VLRQFLTAHPPSPHIDFCGTPARAIISAPDG